MTNLRGGRSGGLVLSSARASECPSLTALALRSKASWGYDDAFMRACRQELVVDSADLADPAVWSVVARSGETPVGFALVRFRAGQDAELEAMFVAPERHREGIGRRLISAVLAACARRSVPVLEIQSDPFAAPFYRALGARDAGELESLSIPGRMLPLLRLTVP